MAPLMASKLNCKRTLRPRTELMLVAGARWEKTADVIDSGRMSADWFHLHWSPPTLDWTLYWHDFMCQVGWMAPRMRNSGYTPPWIGAVYKTGERLNELLDRRGRSAGAATREATMQLCEEVVAAYIPELVQLSLVGGKARGSADGS